VFECFDKMELAGETFDMYRADMLRMPAAPGKLLLAEMLIERAGVFCIMPEECRCMLMLLVVVECIERHQCNGKQCRKQDSDMSDARSHRGRQR
jgi:hypothetical protein